MRLGRQHDRRFCLGMADLLLSGDDIDVVGFLRPDFDSCATNSAVGVIASY